MSSEHQEKWNRRIIGHDQLAPADIVANPLNIRVHPDRQKDGLEALIDEVGFIRSVTINKRTGVLLDGHLRVKLALEVGQELIDVEYVDLDEDQERLALSLLDYMAGLADIDPLMLKQLLDEISTDDPALQSLLADLATDSGVDDLLAALAAESSGVADPDELPAPDDIPSRTMVGDIWIIDGKHRLAVGDCTDPMIVARLLDGARPDLVITDPPYGMGLNTKYSDYAEWANKQVGGKYAGFRRKGGSSKSRDYAPVIGDDQPYDPAPLFVFYDAPEMFLFGFDYFVDGLPNFGKDGSKLVWDKREDSQGGNVDDMFGSCFELVWSKKPHKRDIIRVRWAGYFGTEKQDIKKRIHPTQKPLEVFEWIMERYAQPGHIIADPYAGSGSGLIAAHRRGLICYACELHPGYADLILSRAESLGLVVELADRDGQK